MGTKNGLSRLLVVGCVTVCSAAFAQNTQTPRQALSIDNADSALEVIVVTAERRPEPSQTTPATINVVQGSTLDQLHIADVTDLTKEIPGLKMDGNATDERRMGLRGAFNSGDSPTAGMAVGVYIDGVYYAHTTDYGGALFDVKQVEVLRGPQGTLYGQNVVGGLINIVTNDPGSELAMKATASYSRFNRLDVGGGVSGPLSPTLSASVNVLRTRSDGWERNLVTGRLLGALDTLSSRAKLIWRPSDDLTVKFIGDFATDHSYGIPRNIIFGNPSRFHVPSSYLDTYLATDGGYDNHSYSAAILVDYNIGWATISSITAYHDNDTTTLGASYISDPVANFSDDRRGRAKTTTEELRLSGSLSNFRWQFGTFLLYDDVRRTETFNVFAPPGTAFYDFGVTSNVSTRDHKSRSNSDSLFGQASYDITKVFGITVGARYSWDKKHSDFSNFGQSDPSGNIGELTDPPFQIIQDGRWSEFTPKVTLDAKWKDLGFLDSLLLYATSSRGYIAGDFPESDTLAGSMGQIPPETAQNYEAGFKTTFLQHKMTFNATTYHVDYKGLQSTVITNGGGLATASSDAEAWGAEASLGWRPVRGLDLSVDYAYLHTRILNGSKSPNGKDISGNKLPQSPRFTINAMASYTMPLNEDTDVRLTTSTGYKDGVFFDVRNNRQLAFEGTKQKNIDLELALIHKNWELSIWGKNLLNNQAILRAFDLTTYTDLTTAEFNAGNQVLDATLSDPRTYGVTINWKL